MRRPRRCARATLLVSAGIFVALLSGCGSARKAAAEDAAHAPTAPVVKVARHDLSNQLEIASEFEPLQEIEVYAKVSGYIKKLYVDWGTHVEQAKFSPNLKFPNCSSSCNRTKQALAAAIRIFPALARSSIERNRPTTSRT